MAEPKWLDAPTDQDYTAAQDYLEMLTGDEAAELGISQLREAPVVFKRAKDILRSSGHTLLALSTEEVQQVFDKIDMDEGLSPVLLCRAYPVIIADGFDRVSAIYHRNPNAAIPCQII